MSSKLEKRPLGTSRRKTAKVLRLTLYWRTRRVKTTGYVPSQSSRWESWERNKAIEPRALDRTASATFLKHSVAKEFRSISQSSGGKTSATGCTKFSLGQWVKPKRSRAIDA